MRVGCVGVGVGALRRERLRSDSSLYLPLCVSSPCLCKVEQNKIQLRKWDARIFIMNDDGTRKKPVKHWLGQFDSEDAARKACERKCAHRDHGSDEALADLDIGFAIKESHLQILVASEAFEGLDL